MTAATGISRHALPLPPVSEQQQQRDRLGGERFPRRLGLSLVFIACALRLPYLGRPLSPDESGFLIVARAWRPAGDSLYGPYWVDRPPLLLELFKLADLLGGESAIRAIGMAAAAVAVLFIALAAHRVAGSRAALLAGVAALALFSSPVLGGLASNGELLAAPFVATGVWSVVVLVDSSNRWHVACLSILVGASGTAAILVKQNMLDVGVFYVVMMLVAIRHKLVPTHLVYWSLRWSLGGAVVVAGPALSIAALLGSRLGELFFAAYPFRLKAAILMSQQLGPARLGRAEALVASDLVSLGPVILGLLFLMLITHRLTPNSPLGHVVATSVIALAAYSTVSIAVGGSYWHHYLVQLAVPTGLAAGLIGGNRGPVAGRVVVWSMAVTATVAWWGGLVVSTPADGQVVGAVVSQSARPGDTIVSAFGNADVVLRSGLRSPYTYLWSVPARVLDPSLQRFTTLIEGSRAPTWLVVRGPGTATWLRAERAGHIVRRRYHQVEQLCGRAIYVRDDVQRKVPVVPARSGSTDGCRMPLER